MQQNGSVKVLKVSLPLGRSAEIGVIGPDDGDAVLYFHSPSTSGEELEDAASAAEQLQLRLLSVRRPSIACDEPEQFVQTVADDIASVAKALALNRPAVLGWSGGAPFALATAARLGPDIASIHLVSPVPGPLTGSDAVPDQSPRLRQVASTTATSPWVSGPAALRDYQAVAAPWTFDVGSITQPVTVWAPTEDQIVPPYLIEHLARRLSDASIVAVPGEHDWLTKNWKAVLGRQPG
jgi:pimeloyl-ACP methyl ester carboxylesterase